MEPLRIGRRKQELWEHGSLCSTGSETKEFELAAPFCSRAVYAGESLDNIVYAIIDVSTLEAPIAKEGRQSKSGRADDAS
jgi:hypothetical protein